MVKIKRTKFLLGIDKLTSCRLRFVADQILSRMTSGRFSSFLELILSNLFYHFLFRDMTELFMDAKSSATMLRENSAKYML